jgi:hypothetical protein
LYKGEEPVELVKVIAVPVGIVHGVIRLPDLAHKVFKRDRMACLVPDGPALGAGAVGDDGLVGHLFFLKVHHTSA